MAAANLTVRAVERLASALDQIVAERWDDLAATYAWIPRADRDLDLRVGAPQVTKAAAVAVTSVGTSRRIGGGDPAETPIRVTISVSCCHVAAVVRHLDGRVEHATCAEGATVTMLRQWASLEACSGCVSPSEGTRARQRQD